MDPTIDTCAYPTSDIISEMGRLPLKSRKITCRLTFGAGQRLDAALATLAHDKLGRPPTGALLSRLILDLSDPEWARIVRSLPQKPGILLKEVEPKRQVKMDRKFGRKWLEEDEEDLLDRELDQRDND
jgi:hypothetical protein